MKRPKPPDFPASGEAGDKAVFVPKAGGFRPRGRGKRPVTAGPAGLATIWGRRRTSPTQKEGKM